MFLNSKLVSLDEHSEWYQHSLSNPYRRMYIGIINELKVGIVRFDLDTDTLQSVVSINLNPKLRGNDYGFTLLDKAIRLYEQSKDTTLMAIIKKGNSASLKIFQKCDFQKKSENDFFYHLIRI